MINVYLEPWLFSKYNYAAEAILLESYSEDFEDIYTVAEKIEDRMTRNKLQVIHNSETETEISLDVRLVIYDVAIYNMCRYIIKKEE